MAFRGVCALKQTPHVWLVAFGFAHPLTRFCVLKEATNGSGFMEASGSSQSGQGASPLVRRLMRYRAEATSLEGFVQQIACCYLRHGYWFYVTGHIPKSKDPATVDRKLIEKYGIGVSESTRARRKQLGKANLQYLRFERRFVILATHGEHPFFQAESGSIHDIRHIPLKIGGYSISYRPGRPNPLRST
jgi:hypothetical protein